MKLLEGFEEKVLAPPFTHYASDVHARMQNLAILTVRAGNHQ